MTVIKIKGDPSSLILLKADYGYSRKIKACKEGFLHGVQDEPVALAEQGTVAPGRGRRGHRRPHSSSGTARRGRYSLVALGYR